MTVQTGVVEATPAAFAAARNRAHLFHLAMRYGISASGPVAVSGAHFAVSVIFLHALPRADFGLFSFLLIVVPFCLSLNGALLGASITSLTAKSARLSDDETGTHLKVSLAFSAASAAAVFLMLLSIRTAWPVALLLGLYGGGMTMRWFARSHAYAALQPLKAVASDILYGVCLVAALVALAALRELTVVRAASVLLGAAVAGLAPFGPRYFLRQFWPGRAGSFAAYHGIWRDVTRWSLLGVVLTEATANAHAYFVTLISGPAAFALLALGALLMRPVSLIFTALPDLERPAMARAIGAGDMPRAFRIVKEFRTAVVAIWGATVLAAGGILMWFPHLVLKKGYSEGQAMTVAAIFAAIMFVRAVRTPEAVLLQAAREFRALAHASLWSSVVSLVATLALLLAAGPIASLGGVVAGEILLTGNVFGLSQRWRRQHV